MVQLEYDNIIHNKDELLKQLESLKQESIIMLRSMMDCDVFQKDLHALRIVIKYIKDGE